MIIHTLKLIWKERKANFWLLAELIVAFAFLWVSIDLLVVETTCYLAPNGFDSNSTYILKLKELNPLSDKYIQPEELTTTTAEDIMRLTEHVKSNPYVQAASLSIFSYPYSLDKFYTPIEKDSDSTSIAKGKKFHQRFVTNEYFDVFRIKNKKGEIVSAMPTNGQTLVICEQLEVLAFEKESSVGKHLFSEKHKLRVSDVCKPIKYGEFSKPEPSYFIVLDQASLIESINSWGTSTELCVRVKEPYKGDFQTAFPKEMGDRLRVNNIYVKEVTPLSEIRNLSLQKEWDKHKIKLSLMAFILVNVFFGVVSTFWLRTQQRRSELGLRMAMGASRQTLRRYILGEGFLLLSLAAIVSIPILLSLLWADKVETVRLAFTAWRFAVGFAATYLLVGAMIVLGTWYPATQVNNMQSAEALNSKK